MAVCKVMHQQAHRHDVCCHALTNLTEPRGVCEADDRHTDSIFIDLLIPHVLRPSENARPFSSKGGKYSGCLCSWWKHFQRCDAFRREGSAVLYRIVSTNSFFRERFALIVGCFQKVFVWTHLNYPPTSNIPRQLLFETFKTFLATSFCYKNCLCKLLLCTLH